ncbi:transglutaminase family protein [Subtercola sp. YIM 133946]|uniref:transglutaminase family protein n=1 Tax=Subtercola sp. YIM 133946 TaxID=3118909 RepID=UPI002F94CF10
MTRAREAALAPLVFLLLTLPLGGIGALLSGDGWWWSTAFVVFVVVAVAAFVRLLPVPAIVPSIAAFIAWAITMTVMFAPAEALLGFIPSFDTIRTVRRALADAGASIAVQSIPADPVASIVALLGLSFGLLALLADALIFAVRMPALAGLVPLAILSVPYAIHQQAFDTGLFALIAAVYLLLLWLAARFGIGARLPEPRALRSAVRSGQHAARAVVAGALAVLLAVVLPAVTPGLTPESFHQPVAAQLPSVYSSGVDPSIQLGLDLRRTNPVLSLSYTTTSTSSLYLKLVDIDDFTDTAWQPEATDTSHALDAGIDAPVGLAADVATTPITTTFDVSGLRSDWLPLPYPVTDVTGLDGTWNVTPGSLTLTSLDNNSDGQQYQATSLDVLPTAAQLESASTTVPDDMAAYVALPSDISPFIRNTARSATSGATSNYDKAVALQRFFTSGDFTYSTTAPVEGHYDGGNFAAVATFLSAKSGYCIHFASAMAVMARTLGIPSRIAIGYHPGNATSAQPNGTTTYNVYSDQLHAWPELWFPGVGWLSFEPTPGIGLVPPAYSLSNYAAISAAAPVRDSAGNTAAPTAPKSQAETDVGANPVLDPQVQAAAQGRAWLIALVIVVLAVLLALSPALVRRLRRRRRLRQMLNAPDPATLGWQEISDTASDYRFDAAQGETARMFAGRIGHLYHMPAKPVADLLAVLEHEQFARGGAGDLSPERRAELVADVRAIITAISAQASTADDRRALFVPLSLWARIRAL